MLCIADLRQGGKGQDKEGRVKPERIRIKIAERCGWKRGQIKEYSFVNSGDEIARERWFTPDGIPTRKLPDYPNDLNAMHEAIMALPDTVRLSFNHNLMNILHPNDAFILDRTINATAAQRAEAFLRAFGDWEEGE